MEASPPLQIWDKCFRNIEFWCYSKQVSVHVASVILLPILLITCLLTRLTTFHPTFQRGYSQSSDSSVTINDAIIRMISKGRIPNLRHVSRIHRVDVLFALWENQCGQCDVHQDMDAQQNNWRKVWPTVRLHPFSGQNLMRLFWMSLAAFQNLPVLQSFRTPFASCRTPSALRTTSRADPDAKSWKNHHTELLMNAPLWVKTSAWRRARGISIRRWKFKLCIGKIRRVFRNRRRRDLR